MAVVLSRKPGGTGGGGGGPPSGPAGGVLGGTYPNPTFASGTVVESLIYDNTLAVAAANFDTNPTSLAGYTHLEIITRLRTSDAGNNDILVRFNNVSGASTYYYKNSLAASAAGTAITIGYSVLSGGSAGQYAMYRMTIPFYTDTAQSPSIFSYGGSTQFGVADYEVTGHGTLLANAAVTRIQFIPGNSANWAAGSRLMIYGRN